MHNPWRDMPPGPHAPELVTAIIEIPAGSRNKYELDKESGQFKLDRVLYSAVHYPGDYGFIPRTLHEDNDPLDILVRINEPTFPGCQITCRPIGVLKMLDKGEPDEKILAVPSDDPYHHDIYDIADMPPHYLREIEHFFGIYKDLEGKKSDTYGWEDRLVAHQVIKDSVQRYLDLKDGLIDRFGKPLAGAKKPRKGKGKKDAAGIGRLTAGSEELAQTALIRKTQGKK